MTTPSISDLSALREVAEKATPGPWDVWREPCADKYEAANELSEQAHLTDGFAGAVFLLNANGKCPASTGCGPTSEANAAYIAAFNPQTVLALLDHLTSEKARADAAEAEHRFSLGLVDSAQATIASLTEQLARVTAERDSIADANHRQAHCIHLTAQALGPDYSATVDGLPKAAKHVAEQLAEATKGLTAISEIEPAEYKAHPADWAEQKAACEDCQRYKGHPVMHGTCDKHWQPVYDREKHDAHETRILGYRAKSMARDTLATLSRLEKQEGEA